MATFPLQQRLLDCVNKYAYLLLAIIAFVASTLTSLSLLRTLLCYNVFVCCGYCFYKRLCRAQLWAVLGATVVAGGLAWLSVDFSFTPMQGHKFPPDVVFLMYGSLALICLSLMFSYIKIPEFRLLRLWNDRGYDIYLYQNWVYCVVGIVLARVPCVGDYAVVAALLVFVAATAASGVTHALEAAVAKAAAFYRSLVK